MARGEVVAAAAVGVAAVGAAVWWWWREAAPGEAAVGGRVLHIERARGVATELQHLLRAWEAEGTHDVAVAPQGGIRTRAEQQRLYEQGRRWDGKAWQVVGVVVTNATPENAPHVRSGAVDVWPADFNPAVPWERQPDSIKRQFQAFGEFAERRGLVWGGRWRGAAFPNGDQPHVEVKTWRSRPMVEALA